MTKPLCRTALLPMVYCIPLAHISTRLFGKDRKKKNDETDLLQSESQGQKLSALLPLSSSHVPWGGLVRGVLVPLGEPAQGAAGRRPGSTTDSAQPGQHHGEHPRLQPACGGRGATRPCRETSEMQKKKKKKHPQSQEPLWAQPGPVCTCV